MANGLSGQAAIVGIGATEFSKNSGRSEMQLAVECVTKALADAGIDPSEVDGISTFTMDNNPEIEVFREIGGKELKMFSRVHYGGGAACATVQQAAMAVATGVCEVAVCYRAMNERSEYRFGSGMQDTPAESDYETSHYGWYIPHGLVTPASWVAMSAQRYLYDTGATTEDFGRVAVAARQFAATNPNAWFYEKPITLEEHQNSRWIAEPLRLLDCCQESDGGVAIVVTSVERAKKLNKEPVIIKGAAQGACDDPQMMTAYYRKDISRLSEVNLVAKQLYKQAGMTPDDINAAIIYDHFTPFVMTQLEEFGFADKGKAKDFIRAGEIEMGGRLPINMHGGQLGEAYVHGMNGISEAVRQVRGEAVNQVSGASNVLVSAGTGVPTSGLILGRG